MEKTPVHWELKSNSELVFCRIYIVIAWLAGGRPICLITTMITDQIGRHEVLLPINHNYNKLCDILGFSKSKH